MNAARHTRTLAWLALGLIAASPAWALYKVVGPDGKVTYTDRQPADAKAQSVKAGASAGPSTEGLPYTLARVVSRYPVVLITSSNCTSCEAGRQLLKARGVPFAEKTVSTPEDALALSSQEGTDQVPVMRIGGQQVQGFSSTEWNSYLDAAGFPAQSQLPASYKNPAPTSLSPAQPKADAKATHPGRAEVNTGELPIVPTEGNSPAGIRF